MSKLAHPSLDRQRTEVQELRDLLVLAKPPVLLGVNGKSVPLPESIHKILLEALGYVAQGTEVSIVPVMQELTTQQAANVLGVSRPFLIELLDRHEIPFHKTGTHRRVYRKDVLDYRARRDRERKRVLGEIAKRALAEGDYDQIPVPAEGE